MACKIFVYINRRGILCLRITWLGQSWRWSYSRLWSVDDEFKRRIQHTYGYFYGSCRWPILIIMGDKSLCSKSYTSQLHVNKRIVGSTFAYCGYNTVTGNAVVQLRKGDVVFVRTLSGSGKIRSNEYGRTSFSGVLVKWSTLRAILLIIN